jgi:hypothetical protein
MEGETTMQPEHILLLASFILGGLLFTPAFLDVLRGRPGRRSKP